MKNFIIGAVLIGVAVIAGAFIVSNAVSNGLPLGASPGPTHYNMEYFKAGVVFGGATTTLSTSGTSTLSVAQTCDSSDIAWSPKQVNATLTMPAALTIISRCLVTDGDAKWLFISNSSTTAGSMIRFGTTTVDMGTGTSFWVTNLSSSTAMAATDTPTGAGAGEMMRLLLKKVSPTSVRIIVDRIVTK